MTVTPNWQLKPTPSLTGFEPDELAALAASLLGLCPKCWSVRFERGPGSGPHHARVQCADCGRFVRWVPKP